jgi:hypothetical protein
VESETNIFVTLIATTTTGLSAAEAAATKKYK